MQNQSHFDQWKSTSNEEVDLAFTVIKYVEEEAVKA